MATDQQVRERFLEESGEYFEQMEQVLLGLPDADNPAQQIDVAMRAAHSLKGGAGMMGFTPMAQVAHRLEDFLKIIRARQVQVDTDIETLLLQGVDVLKDVRLQLSSGLTVDDGWMIIHVDPIIEQLKERLGELNEADEDRLLSEEEEIDVAVLVFNGGVEEALDTFEASLDQYAGEDLREALREQANRLSELGLMGGIDAFVSLCQSVYEQAETLSIEQVPALRDQALTAWRRSQSLVQLGRTGKLPDQLMFVPDPTLTSIAGNEILENSNGGISPTVELGDGPLLEENEPETSPFIDDDAIEETSPLAEGFDISLDSAALANLQAEMAAAASAALDIWPTPVDSPQIEITETAINPDLIDIPLPRSEDIGLEQETEPSALEASVDIASESEVEPSALELFEAVGSEADPNIVEPSAIDLAAIDLSEGADLGPETDLSALDLPELDLADLSQLQAAFDQIEIPKTPTPTAPEQALGTLNDQAPVLDPEETLAQAPAPTPQPPRPKAKRKIVRPQAAVPGRTGTLRVAAEELQQINDLFGTLILERNAINLRQKQLDDFATLLQERMQDLEAFNVRLRQWYDRASMESLLPTGAMASGMPVAIAASRVANGGAGTATAQDFDALEMDQYSELHLMAREQMETVVKLQEVTADIRLGLRDMGQVTQSLNGTTRQLQNRITRTQMRPFSDVVGRFPRLIRDLSVQYGKKVKLKIEGETTLFERIALDVLADPLTHILRNSFDHGIEPNDERVEAGKPAAGLITMRASQLGNRARITIRDDGRGINLDKIRDRMRKHDIDEAVINKMSEQDLLAAIFDAGFSTADKVTELSGRGVGMDVVRTNLKQVGGEIQVDTKQGKGTTFTIDIPLSLSVLRIILLEQHSLLFAVPVDAIEELTALNSEHITESDEGTTLTWQGKQIPWIKLEDHLTFNGRASYTPPEGKPTIDHTMALIVSHEDSYYGVEIQRYWGEQEVATRPITSPIPLPTGFVGSTVLGNGRVVPLVDLPILISSTTSKQTTPEDAPDNEAATPTPTAKESPQIQQTTVLVVDDSVHLRRYLTLSLEKAGYYVEQARDGQEAVDKLLGGLQVQAVLCDVEMPRLDGYGVLDEIKTRPEFESLPISMLTSRSSEKHRKLAMNLGASAYFAKPYNEQELLTTLEQLIAEAA